VIADIKVDLDLPTERLAFFDPPWNPGNTVLMHREPNGIWRIDFQLPPGETPEQAKSLESLAPRINAQLELATGKTGLEWELDWCSVYSARAMTLTNYRQGRILFSGDAGHMLPIFGVRGANTGWQDCQNLAWKLALVVKGQASEHLLRSYSEERVGAAWEIIEEASKSTRFMTPPSHGFRLLRDAVLALSLTQEFVRPLYHWRTSRPHEYLNSHLNATDDDNAQFTRGPRHGAQLDNIKLGEGDYLLDHAGAAFQLIWFDASIPADVQAEVKTLKAGGLPLQLIAVVPADGPVRVEGADLTLRDTSGHFHAKYGATGGAAYLARPDQHVCARWLKTDGKRIAAAVKTALAQ
jgi:3-(3-hydroxy-phenyl)propionate hydroxylase